jgi:hypothetical protein
MDAAGFEAPWPTVFRFLLADPNEGLNLRNEVLHDLAGRRPPRHRVALVLQAALVLLHAINTGEPAEEVPAADTPG